jgi:hypothetical protein
VIEGHVGKGDEAFITEYATKTLLRSDLELVPWMVGITSSEGGFFQKSEATYLRQITNKLLVLWNYIFPLSLLQRQLLDPVFHEVNQLQI